MSNNDKRLANGGCWPPPYLRKKLEEAGVIQAQPDILATTSAEADAKFQAVMDAMQTVIQLKVGHTLTETDIADIRLWDEALREEAEDAIDAFHDGVASGRKDAGNPDWLKRVDRLEQKNTQWMVRALLAESRLKQGAAQ